MIYKMRSLNNGLTKMSLVVVSLNHRTLIRFTT